MNKNKLHTAPLILLTLLSLCLAACTSEADLPVPQSGEVRIRFSVANAPEIQTRDTEAGWNDEWNENRVSTLHLYILDNDNTIIYEEELAPDVADASSYKEIAVTGIAASDIQDGYTFYLIANCPDDVELPTVKGTLSKDLITQTTINPIATQKSFLMDGHTVVSSTHRTDKDLLIPIDLTRAAAKIRISFRQSNDATNNANISEAGIEARLMHYAPTSYVLARTDKEVAATTLLNTDWTSGLLYENQQLVFYSYANNWFDNDRFHKNGDKSTIDKLHSEAPIVANRQTYVMLHAPYWQDGTLTTEKYYYKIPVNFQLPIDNDATYFTAERLEEIKDLYRVQRNYLYDVTVILNCPGGDENDPTIPEMNIRINDWQETPPVWIHPDDFEEDKSTEP